MCPPAATLRSASVWRRQSVSGRRILEPEHPIAPLRRYMLAVYFWQGGGLYILAGTATLTDCNVYQNIAGYVSGRELKSEQPQRPVETDHVCPPVPRPLPSGVDRT